MVSLGKIHVEFDQELNDGLGGTITSANFPENYDHNTDCSFTILPVPGNHVTLQVTTLYSRVAEVAREHGWPPPKSLDSDESRNIRYFVAN